MLKSCEKELLLLLHPVSRPNEETLASEFHLLKCSKQHFLSKPKNSDFRNEIQSQKGNVRTAQICFSSNSSSLFGWSLQMFVMTRRRFLTQKLHWKAQRIKRHTHLTLPFERCSCIRVMAIKLRPRPHEAGTNNSFTLTMYQMFSVHNTLEEFKNTTIIAVRFGFVFVFEENSCFRDGLVWTVGLTIEKKLRFCDVLVWTVGLTIEIKQSFRDGLLWTVGLNVEIPNFFGVVWTLLGPSTVVIINLPSS